MTACPRTPSLSTIGPLSEKAPLGQLQKELKAKKLHGRLDDPDAVSDRFYRYLHCGADGCQITPEAAGKLLSAIEKTDCFDGVKLADYDQAIQAGAIRLIGDECLDAFVDAVLELCPGNDISKLKLVYTPLNGSGLECVKKLLSKMGVAGLTLLDAMNELYERYGWFRNGLITKSLSERQQQAMIPRKAGRHVLPAFIMRYSAK